ncbi:PTS transporter subunit EIIC [Paenibacillus sp. SYP-B3998]|uniref:PTS transporter subunit EIIC n=1 Tax=Paenibacillus sp. SYP-B3998 TaxID=2678564 RepID=A0A6G4A2I4_9BACL|nr:PTS transporter subunit EIIC [Paenibacillus sp. SYP-B3998]NEW08706.1 PTS transporter subunit EIIC [Paenibacillus sp. SYP-B3998]
MMYMLQKVGRSLMIPIAVLPAASILLRIGKMKFEEPLFIHLAQIFESGGSAIFDNLPMIFAVGIAIGLTSGDGIAALAATVGYLVFDNVLKHFQVGTESADKLDMGVLGGMLVGMLSAFFFDRFQHIQLPRALGFFGGKRFVPLITALTMVILGVLMGFLWPPVQKWISTVGLWIVDNGDVGVFIYGFMNRLLIPTGLHHIINNIAWFQIGDYVTPIGKIVHGDIARYFAGDPTAGMFMTGYYPVIMFGLPAAALAMIKASTSTNRQIFISVMLSAGLTSFLTGITEPIEFAFMFVAPGLYFIHACLTGLSMMIMHMLDVKMGFGFSAGFIDMLLNWNLSTKPYWIILIGIGYFFIYYFTFRAYLHLFPSKLLGRDEAVEPETQEIVNPLENKGNRPKSILKHIGGPENIITIDACITRLRLLVNEESLIHDAELKQLGAIGVIRLGKGNVHVVFGTESEQIRESIKPMLLDRKESDQDKPKKSEVSYD